MSDGTNCISSIFTHREKSETYVTSSKSAARFMVLYVSPIPSMTTTMPSLKGHCEAALSVSGGTARGERSETSSSSGWNGFDEASNSLSSLGSYMSRSKGVENSGFVGIDR
eukprot:scaffold1112_cov195-Alexandrium_tamarense.AAC.15